MNTTDYETAYLERALDLLDEHGWCQHQLLDADGRMCLSTAMSRAMGSMPYGKVHVRRGAIWRLTRAAGLETSDGLIAWQDEDERTVEDVKLAFKYAIAGERL
jgi:hypothetical protein